MGHIKKIVSVLMIISLLCSCKSQTYNVYEKVYNTYNNMNSFSAKVEVTAYSNNSENKYTLIQSYKSPDKSRSEYVADDGSKNVTIICDGVGKIISDYAGSPVILEKTEINEKDYLMLNTFFDIYYSSEETSVKTSGGGDNKKITLSAETGSSNEYRKRAELTINSQTLNPIELKIFDNDDKVRLKVEYLEFQLNPTLSDDLFK